MSNNQISFNDVKLSKDDNFSLDKIIKLKEHSDSKIFLAVDYHYCKAIKMIKEYYNKYAEFCYYIVNSFIPRLPYYNSVDVAKLLVKRINETEARIVKNLECRIFSENKIYISWKPKVKKKKHINIIFNMLIKKIEEEAKNGKDNIFFRTPQMLMEYPFYNVNETSIIIANKMSEKGFTVKILNDLIYVSWKDKKADHKDQITFNHDKKIKKKSNDIEQINYKRLYQFANPKVSSNNTFFG